MTRPNPAQPEDLKSRAAEKPEHGHFQGKAHPYHELRHSHLTPDTPGSHLDVPPMFKPGVPEALQKAVKEGKAIHFTSPADDKKAKREPDFVLKSDGTLERNSAKKTADPDGSITIELQTKDSRVLNSLAARLNDIFKKENPNWLADMPQSGPNHRPTLQEFQRLTHQGYQPAPEHGFHGTAVHHHRGVHSFAHHGGFDSRGYFHGHGHHEGHVSLPRFDEHGKPLAGGEKVAAKEIYDYLISKGLTPTAASGVLGNMMTESSLDSGEINHKEGALGLCQWEKGRLGDLERFAQQQGKPATDWHTQVDFMMHELQTHYQKAFAAIQHAGSPGEAAAAFDRLYEISAGTSRGKRIGDANEVFRNFSTA